MLKVMLCSRRHASMSRDEFFKHLTHVHAALVLGTPEFLPYLRRYVQNHAVLERDGVVAATAFRRATERDSVIELWFESAESLDKAMRLPKYLERIRPDEARFNDLGALIVLKTGEELVFETGPAGDCKLFEFVMRSPGLSPATFIERWRNHGANLRHDPAYRALVRKRVHNIAGLSESDAFAASAGYDGVNELWLEGFDVAATLSAARFRAPEQEYIDPARSFCVLAREVPIYTAAGA